MNCYTYILYSKILDKYYVGHTCMDLEDRLKKHNTNHKGFTGRANDWQIAHFEVYETKKEAYSRERAIKSKKSRKYIDKFIAGMVHADRNISIEHPDISVRTVTGLNFPST